MLNSDAAERIVRAYERGQVSRREMVGQLLAMGAAIAGMTGVARGADEKIASTFAASSIDHIALSVTDVKRSAAWYQKHLGLTAMRDGGEGSQFLGAGKDFVALFKGDKPGLHHFSFAIPKYEPGEAVKALEAAGLTARREGGRVYFDDPDGIVVQVSGERK